MEAAVKMADKVNNAILNGTGAGSPLGITVAPGTVSVAKETSQVAATIVGENVVKMWSRMPAANRARAVWLAHSDCDVQLAQMNFKVKNVAGTENVGGIPVFMPPGTVNSTPYATLFGRPVMTMERCAALGTVGDFILADMSQYIAVTKGGVKAEQSMHFFFDQNARAFRFVLRLGGQPWLSAAIARASGSSTLGHFVTLATRG
jgi:HK97 family phage major capsid protein